MAQSYQLRYVTITSGAVTFTGNTLGLAKVTGQNQPGALDSIGGFITLNTNSQLGNYPAGTTLNWSNNSSSAVLVIPTNSTVLYAELIWGGTAQVTTSTNATGNVIPYLNTPVEFILPDGTTNSISPDPATASLVTNGPANNPSATFYVRSANVSSLVGGAGAGTYSIGGVPGCALASEDANNACGWTLAVVYGNASLHQRNLSLFIGNSFASTTAPTPAPVAVTGFCAPPSGPVNGYLLVSAIEGDPNKTGDEMLFGPSTNSLALLSGPNNLSNNFFASQINYCQPGATNNGMLDKSGTFGLSNSVPGAVAFSARQGWDITCVNVSAGLTNGIQSAYAQNITQGDGYSVNALALQIDVGSPVLTTAQSVDKASTYVGDTLTYTVVVTNSGTADAVNLIFTDPLPFGTSFIANTFTNNGVTIAGADPVNGVPVSIIKQNSTITFTYQVTVNQIPPSARFVTAATINFQYVGACAQSPIINATLINANVQTLVPLLNVSKLASLTNVIPGATFTYTINMPNQGTTNTVGATLLDPIPAGVTYVTNTTTLNGVSVPDLGGTTMPYTVATEINSPGQPVGQINAGSQAVVAFQVKISSGPPARINNTATIYANGIEPTTAEDAAANIDPVYSDLAVGIAGSPNPVAAGDPITYTISVTNNGPDSLNIITNFLTLYLPVSAAILSPVYTPASGTYDSLNGVWSGLTLPSNGVVTMTISGTVNPAIASSNVISSVTVTPPPGVLDIVTNNNSASATNAVIKVTDLAVTLTDGVTNVLRGEALTYIVTILNLGPSTVDSLILTNSFSTYLTNLSVAPAQGTYNSYNGVWDGLNIPPGGYVTMSVQATVASNVIGAFTNVSVVSAPPGVTDPVLANNATTNVNVVFTNVTADVAIGKSAPAFVFAAGNLTYTISVTNFGPFAGAGTLVTDTLPAGVSFVSASGGGVNNSGVVTWNLGSLGVDAISNVTVTVLAPVSGSLTNTAKVGSPTLDPNLTNNTTPPVVTLVTPLADLAIAKSGPATVLATSNLIYTIAVTNFGPSSASTVVVTDSLPMGVTFVSATGGGSNNLGAVNWNLGALASGQMSNLTVTVTAPASGTLTNVAVVASPTGDTNILNNVTPPVVTTVTTVADLAVGKAGPAADSLGVTFNYSIWVTNFGPSTVASFTVTDTLPVGINFVSSLPATATNAVNQVIWTNLGLLASGATTNLTLTVQATSRTILTNIASVGGPTLDLTPANNTSLPVVTSITNRPPVALSDTASTARNVAVTIPVLANDSDPDGDPLTIVSVNPTNGTAFVSGTNIVYTPTNAVPGTNVFSYTITDGFGGTSSALVTVYVTNRPPVAVNDTASTARNVAVTIPVLANDSDPDGDPLTIVSVNPTNGTAFVSGTNIVYTPTNAIPGTNVFSYTITDGFGGTSSALVTVYVTNRPPVAVNDTASTARNVAVTIPVLANDSDPDGDPLTIVSVNPTNGTAFVSGTNIVYTPTNAVPGTNVLSYTITDGFGGTSSSVVTVYVTNRPPVAVNDTASTPENVAVPVPVLVNDSDPDGDSLTIVSVSPTNGLAVISGTNVIFTPATNFLGTATVGYKISDGFGGTNGALISIVVTNIPPVANPDNFAITENTTNLFAVLANDLVATPGGSLTLVSVSTTNGAALVSGTNVVFTPATNFLGTLTLNYTISDNIGGTNSSHVFVLVTNTPPVANPDSYTVLENSTNTLTPLVNDLLQTPGGSLTIIAVSPTNGTASILNNTNVTFTPANNFTGTATIGYTISDGIGGSNSSVITVTVQSVADITVSKTGPSSVYAATNFNYTITVTNLGPGTATSLSVTDSLPSTVALLVTPAGAVVNGSQVVWTNLGSLASGSATNLIVTVIAPVTSLNLTNVAGAGSPTSDPNLTNNTSPPVITTVTPVADLVIAKSGPAFVPAVSNINYTITVTNFGPSSASSVVVTDTLPAGVIFVGASGGGSNNSGAVSWSLGSMAAGQGSNLTVTVTAPASGTLTNVASVGSPTLDTNMLNNTTPPVVTAVTLQSDLAVGKSGPSTVLAASNMTYTISVTNLGPSAASSVVVTDSLPSNVSFVGASGGGLDNSGLVTWSLGNLPNGAVSNVTLTVLAPASSSITNVATVGWPSLDPNLTNNTSAPVVTTVIPLADVVIAKTGPASVYAASNFTYTISVTNLGPSSASSVVVTDTLPAGVTFVSAADGGTNNSGLVNWNLGTLAAGQTSNITVTVTAPASGTLTNIAYVASPTGDTNILNNLTPPVVTSVTPVADLSVVKTGPAGIIYGTNFNYLITVSNAGPSTASSVTVTDSLPAGLVFVSAVPATTTNAFGQVIWNLGNFAADTGSNLTVTVISTLRGSLTNLAGGGSPTFDPVPTNNLAPPVVTVVTNNPPIANPDSFAITENTTNIFNPLANDVLQTPGGSLTIITASSTNGMVSILNNTNVVFTPTNNFIGTTVIGYSITDNVGGANNSFITVLVTNIPPVANSDAYSVAENSTNILTPLVNDLVKTPGGVLQIVSVNPTNGTAVILNLTNVVFTPTSNFVGTATIGYTITDSIGGTNSSLITLTVTNLPPAAFAQSVATTENTALPVTLTGSDPAGHSLTFSIVSGPAGGTLMGFNTNTGSLIYTPTNNFTGTDTFTFRVNNGYNNSSNATVTIAVTRAADLLVAQAGPASGIAGANLIFTVAVTNLGPAGATNIVVTNQLDTGFTFISASGGGATHGSHQVIWTVPVLPANFATNFTVTLSAVESGTFTNIASGVSATPDLDATNNNGSLTNAQSVTTVSALADVAVFKTGNTSVLAGGSLSYLVTATNFGPSTASNVVVRDSLPAGATLTTASGNYIVSNNIIIWSAVLLPGGATTNFSVTLIAPSSGILTNIASSVSDTADPNPGNNDGSSPSSVVVTPVTPVADLAAGKSAAASVLAAGNLVYTISVTNFGPSTAGSITVTDALPAGVSFVGTTGGGANSGAVVIWNLGNLASGAVSNVTLTVTASTSGTLTNVATVGSPTGDPNLTNNVTPSVVTTIIPQADLQIGKSAAASVLATGNLIYTISVTNFGPSTASSVTVTDALPVGTSFVGTTGGGIDNAGVITWSLGNLSSGAVSNVTLTVAAPASGSLTNIASAGSPIGDPNLTNNVTPPVITTVTPVADVAIGKTAAAAVLATGNLVYSISVTNFGPSTASSVTVTDALPVGVNFVSATGGGVNSAGMVTWSLGDLASGAVSNLTLIVAVPTSGTLTNVATVGTPVGDPDLTNNITPPVVTTVTPVADVAVGKTGPIGVTLNTNFSYTISVTNFGPSLASGILVTDSLPAGLVFAGAVPAATTNTSGQVIWSLGNLGAGTTTNLALTVISTSRGSVTNIASVCAPTLDPAPTNNLSQPVITLVTNIPPVANPDSYSIAENSGANILTPLLNDLVLNPGGTLQLVSVATTNGTATISGTNVLFVPGTNYFGPLTITYTITDSVGGTNGSYIIVRVTNIPPVANPDNYTISENSGATLLSPLVNDVVGTPGGILSLLSLTPTNGTATISGTNVLFTPAANFFGTATIGYTITDGIGGTSTSLITVNVTNVTPLANGQSVNTPENVPVLITLTGSDPNHLPLTFAIVGNPTNGILSSLNSSTGTIIYTPNTNSTGADSFTFRVSNGQTNSAPATVNISIAPAADLVVVQSGPASGSAGSNLVFTVSVTNRGPATATSLVVSNQLDAGYTFVTASSGGVDSGNVVIWNVASLPANGVTNFIVTVFAAEGGSFTNIASGTSAVLDLNPTNNNGSLGNAKSITVLTPVADLVVYKNGGTNVYAGAAVSYAVIASNAGPSTATSVVVQDTLPAGAVFQSASGTYSISNGVVTWNVLTLGPGAVTTFNITLLAAPTVTSFVNIASGTSPIYDPNLTNNNGSYAKSRVTTKVTPSADVIANITGPTNAIVGSNMVFTLTITNAGPSTASNVVASDIMPSNLLFVSASGGGTNSNGANASGTITWPPILALPAGGSTNYTFTARSLVAGIYTNVVSSTSVTFDPNPTNNTGVLPSAQAQTQVSAPQFTISAGAPVFNPQDGLYEEQVTVTNTGAATVAGIQLYVTGLRSGVSLYNGAGVNNGVPYVQYGYPLDPSNSVHFVLEFYDPSRLPFSNSLFVVAYMPTNLFVTGISNRVAVSTFFEDKRTNPPRMVIEWASTPGKTYLVIYSDQVNPTSWNVATPSITATANITQWYDDGPPKTSSEPLTANSRFYVIIQY